MKKLIRHHLLKLRNQAIKEGMKLKTKDEILKQVKQNRYGDKENNMKIRPNFIWGVVIGIMIACMVMFFAACHHHTNPPTPQPQPNPASYTYTATLVASHQPGFFSCANFVSRIVLGTYQDYHNKMHAQLCELIGNKIKVLHTFDGESVYHIRTYPKDDYMILPIEQGNLYRYDSSGVHELKHRTYHMGFYDFCWLNGHNYSLEKKNIYPPNVVAIYKDLQSWFLSTGWKAKDMVPFKGKLYCSATGLNNRTEGAIVEIDPATKAVKYFKHFRWCWTGCLNAFDDAVWATFDCDGIVYNTKGEEWHLGDHGWYVGKIWDTIFATTGGKWRGSGPSHLYVFNSVTRQFEKKLDLDTCEPWFMCAGNQPYTWYLVSRCEKGNIGKVFLIRRTK